MVTMQEVLSQFQRLRVRPSFLARGEIKELPNILLPGEQLSHVVMGWYDGGLALLCSTNHRVLLIDKKPFFLTVEDLRYNMIAEVRYQYRLLDANICLTYAGKSLDFKSWNQGRLRELVSHVQEAIMENKKQQEQMIPGPMTDNRLSPQPNFAWEEPRPTESPAQYYQPEQAQEWPRNPYQTGRQLLRRSKVSRFVTLSQINRY
jgi:hypothetical protein